MSRKLILAILAIATAACGSTPASQRSGSLPVGAGRATAVSPARPAQNATTKVPAAAPSSAPESANALPSSSPLQLSIALAKGCLGPGETQALTVHTQPKAGVIFDTTYSDGKSGGSFGGNYGGNAGGFADTSGRFESAWVLAPNAPPGEAKVRVIASRGNGWGERSASFRVRSPSGAC